MNEIQHNDRKYKAIIIHNTDNVIISIPPFFKPVLENLARNIKRSTFECLKCSNLTLEMGDRDYFDIEIQKNHNETGNIKNDLKNIENIIFRYSNHPTLIDSPKEQEQNNNCLSYLLSPIYTGMLGIHGFINNFTENKEKPKQKKA